MTRLLKISGKAADALGAKRLQQWANESQMIIICSNKGEHHKGAVYSPAPGSSFKVVMPSEVVGRNMEKAAKLMEAVFRDAWRGAQQYFNVGNHNPHYLGQKENEGWEAYQNSPEFTARLRSLD